MRPVRFLLAATVAAFGLTAATATAASAAPPVGCYGLPDYPAAFFCVTSFTPTNAVGEPSSVTVPTVCAGDCYGPFSVPVPGGSSGAIATVVYGGQTYVIAVGQVPLPAPSGSCPGSPLLGVETEPYACFHQGSDYYGSYWYVGTCATGSCTTRQLHMREVDLQDSLQRIADEVNDVLETVRDAIRCESLRICSD